MNKVIGQIIVLTKNILLHSPDALQSGMEQFFVTHPCIESRSIVKIELPRTRKSVFCEVLMIDSNYGCAYKSGRTYELPQSEAVITINSWYRKKLGASETNKEYILKITPTNHMCGKFMACIQHPQVVVRMDTWLGAFSLALGALGIGIAICAN